METDTVMVLFFVGTLLSFGGLRAAGVSSERIGQGAARVVLVLGRQVPILYRAAAYIRCHRKAAVVFGSFAVIVFVPALIVVALLVAILFVIKLPGDAVDLVSGSAADAGGISGILVEHGEAPYLNNNDNSHSYFVELMRGDQTKVVWGVGLSDAIGKAGAAQGDTISLKHTGREAVRVPVFRPEAGGHPVWKSSMRNRWEVEVTRKSDA